MKRPTRALASLLARAARAIGAEGAFLGVGTILLAIGASYIAPAGPWLIVGAVALLIGVALALPAPTPPKAP